MTADSPSFVSDLPPGGFLNGYKSFCWRPNSGEVTCLPHAFIGGFPKCGTTDLYDKLVWHPDILQPPAGKENHYFARTRVGRHVGLTQRGSTSKGTLLQYSKRMTPADMEGKQNAVILDGTPTLLDEHIGWEKRFPWASEPPYTNADILYFSTPQAKVVAMVRDPTDRLWSDYLYFDRHDNRTPEHFRTQVPDQIAAFTRCLKSRTLRQCCFTSENSIIVQLHKGIYVCYLQDWLENFRDNLLVLTMEEYSLDQLGTLRRVYKFLGVEVDLRQLETFLERGEVKNSRTKERVAKGDMLAESRELVEEFYRPYNRMLAEYLQDEKFLFRDSYQ